MNKKSLEKMSESMAFQVESKDIDTSKKERIDATVTRLDRCGTIIERKRLAGETGRTPVKAQKKNKI